MSGTRGGHLVERAVERMAELGTGLQTEKRRPIQQPGAEPDAPGAPAPDVFSAADGNGAPVTITMDVLKSAGLTVAGEKRSRMSEDWRVTSGQLLRTMRAGRPANGAGDGPAPNLLLVTSSKPREGKSFSALNLSGSLALSGQAEVLLVDIDSKPGAMTTMLGLGEARGLFDLISDPALRSDDVIFQTAIRGFSVLPIGRSATNGSMERTVTRPVVAMIEKLARRYARHLIVLDSAPSLATSDASTLAPVMSQIAVVVEAERTQRQDLEATLEMLRPCPNISLVLNKTRQAATSAYDDYYYTKN